MRLALSTAYPANGPAPFRGISCNDPIAEAVGSAPGHPCSDDHV